MRGERAGGLDEAEGVEYYEVGCEELRPDVLGVLSVGMRRC